MKFNIEVHIVDEKGQEVKIPFGQQTEKVHSQESVFAIPKGIDYYRDATKWLVALSSGAIVFAFGFFQQGEHSLYEKIIFSLSGFFFFVAVFSGIWSHLNLIELASYREKKSQIDKTKDIERLNKNKSFYFNILIFSFSLGMFTLVGFGFMKIFSDNDRQEKNNEIIFYQVGADDQKSYILMDRNSNKAWIVDRLLSGDLTLKSLSEPGVHQVQEKTLEESDNDAPPK